MGSLASWLKHEDGAYGRRYQIILRAVLMAALPVFCCMVQCGLEGRKLGDVFLPASPWNDELFYYKQVDGILKSGFPLGFYGFNESHALKLSFAAWSPVLLIPWILWGAVFGWNYAAPVACNIFLLSLAAFLFMIFVKPSWKQTGILAFLFCLFTPFVRYMLSGMPEITCFSLLIIFYGLAIGYLEKEHRGKLAALFFLAGLLTLMRPYMLLFLVLPAYFAIRRYRLKGGICAGGIIAVVLGIYALLKHFLSAEYFTPLFNTDFVTVFFEQGIGQGIHHFFGTFYWKGKALWDYLVRGVKYGYAPGAFFDAFLVIVFVIMIQCVADLKKSRREERKNSLIIELHVIFSYVGMLAAELLMYKLEEGSKHFLTFIAAGIFIVALLPTKSFKKPVLVGAVFAYFFIHMAVAMYDYQIPFADEAKKAQLAEWHTIFEENISVSREKVPSYDNDVIWTLNDQKDGQTIYTKWQLLYELPGEMGISCCMREYLTENIKALNSRYLTTLSGGTVDELCRSEGYRELARDEDLVLYELR